MKTQMIIHPDELSKKWIDRLAENGISGLGIHPRGGAEATESLKQLLQVLGEPEYRDLIDYANANGLEVAYEIHAAGYLLPREMFNEHPEYFRVNKDGERTNDKNFCVSCEPALDLFAKNAAELALSLYGSCHNFYFWMDDGHDLRCECEKCKVISASDQQMIALNRAIKEIKKHIPDARMAYLAYMDSIVTPTVVPEKDVFLEYAPFEKYTAKGVTREERIQREKKMIAPLIALFGEEGAKVLEYWYDNSLFSGWKKPPVSFELDEADMRKDIKEYLSTGFQCISTFACFLGDDYEDLHGDVDVLPFAQVCK